MNTDKTGQARHKLMAWLSPNFPIGAFSYSHGLEFAIQAGDVSDADSLEAWLVDILRFGTGRNEAILLAAAFRATTHEDQSSVDELACALAGSAERYLETTNQASAFCKTFNAVENGSLAFSALPVAVGVAGRQAGLALADLLPLYLHSFAANIIMAGVRLIPIGQNAGQTVLANLFDIFDEIARAGEASSLSDLGGATILADMASMKHETMRTRIFRT